MSRPLPPLNSVRAFEVATRHLNFSRAAEEAGVTPGAISKQILLLEDYIGHKLFERRPGGLSLTLEGHALKSSVAPAFEMLSGAFDRYSRRAPRSNVCRIATLASFAAEFLVPRLDRFAQKLPHIEPEILTSHRLVDFAREEVDVGVRFGQGGWDDVVASELIKGELNLVCAPELMSRKNDMDLASFVQSTRRIQLFSNNEWRMWERETGISLAQASTPFIVEDSLVSIAAAEAGQGLALVPEILTRQAIATGRLVTVHGQTIPWDQTYYITHPPNTENDPIVRSVIEWLREEVMA